MATQLLTRLLSQSLCLCVCGLETWMYTVSDFRFPVYRLLSFCQRKSKSSSSKNTRRETKPNEKSKEKFALVSSLAAATTAAAALPPFLPQSPSPFLLQLLPHLLSSVVILNFDAGTFCALPWLLLKIYTRAYLGTCFAILLPVPSPPLLPFLGLLILPWFVLCVPARCQLLMLPLLLLLLRVLLVIYMGTINYNKYVSKRHFKWFPTTPETVLSPPPASPSLRLARPVPKL